MTSPTTVPKPYSIFFNPFLTLSQKIVSILIDFILGLKGLSQLEIGSKASEDALSKLRVPLSSKSFLQRWANLSSPQSSSPGILAESFGFIPFRKNILQEWNIVDKGTKLPDAIAAANDRKGVKILVRFPSSLLPAEVRERGKISEHSGCLDVNFDEVDWREFAPDVPMLIHFHGGGLTITSYDDPILVSDVIRLIECAPEASPKDVITISVDYGLAPEDPFPLGVMDALSVIDYFLNDTKCRKAIHITGPSAGANISLVAGFEGFRRFPGKIKSIQAQSPFVDPAGDSMSYYMNQSVYPNVQWLRWCWQAYLGMKTEAPSDNDKDETELEKVLRQDSNYACWKSWKADYPSEALHRLVNPALGVPEGLNSDISENAPTIIVRYNMGDPLYDDGKGVHEALKLKTGPNASFDEQLGLHMDVLGPYDVNEPPEILKDWSNAVFGNCDGDSK